MSKHQAPHRRHYSKKSKKTGTFPAGRGNKKTKKRIAVFSKNRNKLKPIKRFDFPKKPSGNDVHFSVFIPSTKNVDEPVSDSEFERRVEQIQNYLSEKFPGTTAYKTEGTYLDSKKGLVTEKGVKVEVYTDQKTWNRFDQNIQRALLALRKKWGQSAMGYTFESPKRPAEEIGFE